LTPSLLKNSFFMSRFFSESEVIKYRLILHLQEQVCKSNIAIITCCEMTSNNLKSERRISVNEKKSNLIVEVALGVCVCANPALWNMCLWWFLYLLLTIDTATENIFF